MPLNYTIAHLLSTTLPSSPDYYEPRATKEDYEQAFNKA
jgi:hypothetical protein